jgi:hypothetical protein
VEQLGQALRLPEPPEDEGRAPRSGRQRLQPLGPHPLHDTQPLAEPGQRLQQLVEGGVRHELVAPAERGDHALADVAALPARLDDLKILARVRPRATTLDAHEHAAIIHTAPRDGKRKTRSVRPRGTTFRVCDRSKRRKCASSRTRLCHCCRK